MLSPCVTDEGWAEIYDFISTGRHSPKKLFVFGLLRLGVPYDTSIHAELYIGTHPILKLELTR